MTQTQPTDSYRLRVDDLGAALAERERRAQRNGNLNVVLFFSAAAALTTGAVRSDGAWYWLAALLAIVFVLGLAFLQRAKQAAAHTRMLFTLNQEGLARLQRNWAALPSPASALPAPAAVTGATLDPATAADLDLLGEDSLQHLLNTPGTPAGQGTLHAWLLQPAAPPAILERQAAARELAPLVDFRDAVAADARQMGDAQAHYERFLTWAESAPTLGRQPLLLWAARLLPLLALALALAAWFQPPTLADLPLYPLLGVVLLLTLMLALTAGNRAGAVIAQVEAHQSIFLSYASLFDRLQQQPLASPELRRLQDVLRRTGQTGTSAVEQMRRLQRLMPLASIRGWMLFLPFELLTLWNIHLLWLLERWQTEAGGSVRAWLTALGEFEALAALGTLHYDHPQWCFPTFEPSRSVPAQVQATDLAHPLLPPSLAVGNDVTLGPPGSFLLVTGSNMSGKSTMLRAIGLNCVLAQMGAPVCAASLRLPPVLVASSMRVQDSLRNGVSYFLAELQSLKAIVDRAERESSPEREDCSGDDSPLLLFLLDEILQGTNSAERQIAARHVIGRLVASGAIGAVSTHDLALAAAPELAQAAVTVHFTESFTAGGGGAPGDAGPSMRFDYKLREGIATSTNALKLMQIIGLFELEDAAGTGRSHA